VLDGEVIVQNEEGIPAFGDLRAAIGHEPDRLLFCAFELLHLEGFDARGAPLADRRRKALQPGGVSTRRSPMPAQSYLNDGVAFDADVTNAMGRAFEDACSAVQVPAYDIRGRLAIAARIIDLARAGVTDAGALRYRVVKEAYSQG
jgi:hypothetical protein